MNLITEILTFAGAITLAVSIITLITPTMLMAGVSIAVYLYSAIYGFDTTSILMGLFS